MTHHILIIGSGSVGKRHAQNLSKLGCTISAMDPREDRLSDIADSVKLQGAYTDYATALEQADNLAGVVIASPPKFHVEQALLALDKQLPILLEKPVSPDLASTQKLYQAVQNSTTPLLLGYTWRWWPALNEAKQLIEKGAIGHLLNVRFTMSAHLADWHPWEAVEDFFMSSKELGGGALLDESHWLDLMLWFMGMPARLFARISKISQLNIDTDDNVDMLIEYDNAQKTKVSIHLDLYSRPHEKSIHFIGDEGTLKWTPNEIAIAHQPEGPWQTTTFDHERNDMFVGVAKEFVGILEGRPVTTCDMTDGLQVMQMIETARLSSERQAMLNIAEAIANS